jgi:hypothetical protein
MKDTGGCAAWKLVAVLCAVPVTSYSAAISNQVMAWFVGVPIVILSCAWIGVWFFRFAHCYPASPRGRIPRALAGLSIVCGMSGVAATTLLVAWPLLKGTPPEPEPFSWSAFVPYWPHWILWPALSIAGVRARSVCPLPVLAALAALLLSILPLKLAWWLSLYERGAIVLGA